MLEVLAQDETDASESATSAVMATVRVRVHDVNDNAPAMIVESQSGDQDIFRVPENCANGTLVAHVAVSDADTGDAGRVDCHLQLHNGVRTIARLQYRECRILLNRFAAFISIL